MVVPFEIRAFSDQTFADELVMLSHGQDPAVRDKPQVLFLARHLGRLGCRTMVVEPRYTDRNFLEDYAAYYVRCFEQYERLCTRLHFFADEFTQEKLSEAIVADQPGQLQESYLGFIVVKPLPQTVIGRTCLRPLPAAKSLAFPPVKPQAVDLYGLDLSVETLPFQEQDREVAACASSALWTSLHSTAQLFQHAKPSPVEITKSATALTRLNRRTFPNGDGLNTLQIAEAIRAVGLEPSLLSVSSMPRRTVPSEDYADGGRSPSSKALDQVALEAEMRMVFKISVLAYLRAGISCLLLARTSDEVNPEVFDDEEGDAAGSRGNKAQAPLEVLERGKHAVALTGYSLSDTAVEEGYRESNTRFKAGRLDAVFVHDDQTGPFTRMTFDEGNRLVAEDFAAPNIVRRFAEPIDFLVPLYHKIRIPLQQVLDLTVALDQVLGALPVKPSLTGRLEWDIELIGLSALRDQLGRSTLSPAAKLELLTLSLPRYLWRVRAVRGTKLAFDLLLDPTDLLQGQLVRRLVPYDLELCKEIAFVFELLSTEQIDLMLKPIIHSFSSAVQAAA